MTVSTRFQFVKVIQSFDITGDIRVKKIGNDEWGIVNLRVNNKKDFTLLKMYRLKCLTLQFVTTQGGLGADPHEKEPNEKDCKCKNYD